MMAPSSPTLADKEHCPSSSPVSATLSESKDAKADPPAVQVMHESSIRDSQPYPETGFANSP